MTQSTRARRSVFSVSSLIAYLIATWFSAKALGNFPTYFLNETPSQSVELATDLVAPLLDSKIDYSSWFIGSGSFSVLHFSFFLVLSIIFYGRFYSHGEALERRY